MFIKFGKLPQTYYEDIFERAGFGVHEEAFKLVKPFLEKGKVALDIGCGNGAFSQRLMDDGIDIDVCEIDISQIEANVKNTIFLDLNKPNLADNFTKKYDFVFILEVIEHIENPWKLIRDSAELLTKNGKLVISTPNISNFTSRLRFFLRGTFPTFEENGLKYGHITPVNFFQVENIFKETGLVVEQRYHVGILPVFHFQVISRFEIIRNSLLPLLIPFMSGPKYGISLMYVLSKK